jgi:GT2 family glycosyltransferase
MPKISVLIVNYNGGKLIEDCLGALMKQSFKDMEIIIVDNHSGDNSPGNLQSLIKEKAIEAFVKLYPLAQNLGFTGGNLEGLKHTSGEYIALINPDAFAEERWLEELNRAMEAHPEVGICASKIIVNGSGIIDSAGDGYTTALKGFKRGEGFNSDRFNQYEYVFGACAGAALYRKQMINEIGFFDQDFFLIHEDADLNYRAQMAGWKVLYVPSALVYHQVRTSIGSMSDLAIYYSARNSEFVRIKNFSLGILARCIIGVMAGFVMEFINFGLKTRKVNIFIRGKIDALRFIPRMMRKRKGIMAKRKVSDEYIFSLMTSTWQKDYLLKRIRMLFRFP